MKSPATSVPASASILDSVIIDTMPKERKTDTLGNKVALITRISSVTPDRAWQWAPDLIGESADRLPSYFQGGDFRSSAK
jgi:hypothetical protein